MLIFGDVIGDDSLTKREIFEILAQRKRAMKQLSNIARSIQTLKKVKMCIYIKK